MVVDRGLHFGWPDDWLGSDQKISEADIRSFVNRYLVSPEDWDSNGFSLTMFWARCGYCDAIFERHIPEKELLSAWTYKGDYIWQPLYEDVHDCDQRSEWFKRKIEENYRLKYGDVLFNFESPLEEYFYKACKLGYPHINLIPQHPVYYWRLDFAHLPSKTAIEIDGKKYHSAPKKLAEDRRRQNAIEREGWTFIRLSGSEVYSQITKSVENAVKFIYQKMNLHSL